MRPTPLFWGCLCSAALPALLAGIGWISILNALLIASSATVGAFVFLRGSTDPLLTVFDTFLINIDRVMAGATPCNGQIISVVYFDQLPSEEAVIAGCKVLAKRYLRFRSLPVAAPSAVNSVFVEEQGFDVVHHVTSHGVRDSAGVARLVEDLANCGTPPAHSPWHLDLIPCEASSGQSAIVLRMQHCLADGLRIVQAASTFVTFASNGEPAEVGMLKRMSAKKSSARPKPSVTQLVGDLVEALTMPNAPAETRTNLHLPKKIFPPADRRVCASSTVSFEAVKRVRAAFKSTTINDVILTAFCAAVRAYVEEVGEGSGPSAEVRMRALCAVSLPEQASRPEGREMCNNFLLLSMPLAVAGGISREERLNRVRTIMARVKSSTVAVINTHLMKLLTSLGLEEVAGSTNTQIMANHSFVFSNVPGFEEPVNAFGKCVERCEVFYNNTISQTIFLTYCDQLTFNLMTCRTIVEQPERLCELFKIEIEEWKAELAAGPRD